MTRPRRSPQLARIEGEQDVRKAIQALVEAEGVRGLASRLKVSPAWISRVALGQAGLTARLARAVGFEKVILFRRATA
jgi:hypothetical protein